METKVFLKNKKRSTKRSMLKSSVIHFSFVAHEFDDIQIQTHSNMHFHYWSLNKYFLSR